MEIRKCFRVKHFRSFFKNWYASIMKFVRWVSFGVLSVILIALAYVVLFPDFERLYRFEFTVYTFHGECDLYWRRVGLSWAAAEKSGFRAGGSVLRADITAFHWELLPERRRIDLSEWGPPTDVLGVMYVRTTYDRFVTVPVVYFLALVLGVMMWVMGRRLWRRRAVGLCAGCGYDLRGHKVVAEGVRCPECGSENGRKALGVADG
jgi:hypothetical protein